MYKQIISEQRYILQINVLLQKKMSKKDIAKAINVDLSTIYRELNRNTGSRNHYNRETAEANTQAGMGIDKSSLENCEYHR